MSVRHAAALHLRARRQLDFEVYYTAGSLVWHHQGRQIYNGADTGKDPQLVFADPTSLFATTAAALRIPEIRLYVYPPTLADLLAPLSLLPIRQATLVWKALMLLALAGSGLLLAAILRLPFLSVWTATIVLAFLLFQPALDGLEWGQISIFMTLLETAGLLFYTRGHKATAMFFFALATAIKLTPGIVVVPLLLWLDWKSLRAFTLWCAAFLALLLTLNGPTLLADFALHVLPSMSHGIVQIGNRSLSTAFQLGWRHLTHGPAPVPLATCAKLCSLLAIATAAWLCRPLALGRSEPGSSLHQTVALSLFFLLSCCTSPVTWWHAYVLSAPALVLLISRALQGRTRALELTFLILFLLAVGQFSATNPPREALTALTPIFGIALALTALDALRRHPATPGATLLQN